MQQLAQPKALPIAAGYTATCGSRQPLALGLCPPSTSTTPSVTAFDCASHLYASCRSFSPRRLARDRIQLVRAGSGASVPEKWWLKGVPENMRAAQSIQHLIKCLEEASAEDRLVVVEFHAKWCHACRTLFPKVCQLCTTYPDVLVLKVDWDDNKDICKALNIKMLPYFQFYRGPKGRVAEFCCSITKIQRLKDALQTYGGSGDSAAHLPRLDEFPDLYPSAADVIQAANNVVAHHPPLRSLHKAPERELQKA